MLSLIQIIILTLYLTNSVLCLTFTYDSTTVNNGDELNSLTILDNRNNTFEGSQNGAEISSRKNLTFLLTEDKSKLSLFNTSKNIFNSKNVDQTTETNDQETESEGSIIKMKEINTEINTLKDNYFYHESTIIDKESGTESDLLSSVIKNQSSELISYISGNIVNDGYNSLNDSKDSSNSNVHVVLSTFSITNEASVLNFDKADLNNSNKLNNDTLGRSVNEINRENFENKIEIISTTEHTQELNVFESEFRGIPEINNAASRTINKFDSRTINKIDSVTINNDDSINFSNNESQDEPSMISEIEKSETFSSIGFEKKELHETEQNNNTINAQTAFVTHESKSLVIDTKNEFIANEMLTSQNEEFIFSDKHITQNKVRKEELEILNATELVKNELTISEQETNNIQLDQNDFNAQAAFVRHESKPLDPFLRHRSKNSKSLAKEDGPIDDINDISTKINELKYNYFTDQMLHSTKVESIFTDKHIIQNEVKREELEILNATEFENEELTVTEQNVNTIQMSQHVFNSQPVFLRHEINPLDLFSRQMNANTELNVNTDDLIYSNNSNSTEVNKARKESFTGEMLTNQNEELLISDEHILQKNVKIEELIYVNSTESDTKVLPLNEQNVNTIQSNQIYFNAQPAFMRHESEPLDSILNNINENTEIKASDNDSHNYINSISTEFIASKNKSIANQMLTSHNEKPIKEDIIHFQEDQMANTSSVDDPSDEMNRNLNKSDIIESISLGIFLINNLETVNKQNVERKENNITRENKNDASLEDYYADSTPYISSYNKTEQRTKNIQINQTEFELNHTDLNNSKVGININNAETISSERNSVNNLTINNNHDNFEIIDGQFIEKYLRNIKNYSETVESFNTNSDKNESVSNIQLSEGSNDLLTIHIQGNHDSNNDQVIIKIHDLRKISIEIIPSINERKNSDEKVNCNNTEDNLLSVNSINCNYKPISGLSENHSNEYSLDNKTVKGNLYNKNGILLNINELDRISNKIKVQVNNGEGDNGKQETIVINIFTGEEAPNTLIKNENKTVVNKDPSELNSVLSEIDIITHELENNDDLINFSKYQNNNNSENSFDNVRSLHPEHRSAIVMNETDISSGIESNTEEEQYYSTHKSENKQNFLSFQYNKSSSETNFLNNLKKDTTNVIEKIKTNFEAGINSQRVNHSQIDLENSEDELKIEANKFLTSKNQNNNISNISYVNFYNENYTVQKNSIDLLEIYSGTNLNKDEIEHNYKGKEENISYENIELNTGIDNLNISFINKNSDTTNSSKEIHIKNNVDSFTTSIVTNINNNVFLSDKNFLSQQDEHEIITHLPEAQENDQILEKTFQMDFLAAGETYVDIQIPFFTNITQNEFLSEKNSHSEHFEHTIITHLPRVEENDQISEKTFPNDFLTSKINNDNKIVITDTLNTRELFMEKETTETNEIVDQIIVSDTGRNHELVSRIRENNYNNVTNSQVDNQLNQTEIKDSTKFNVNKIQINEIPETTRVELITDSNHVLEMKYSDLTIPIYVEAENLNTNPFVNTSDGNEKVELKLTEKLEENSLTSLKEEYSTKENNNEYKISTGSFEYLYGNELINVTSNQTTLFYYQKPHHIVTEKEPFHLALQESTTISSDISYENIKTLLMDHINELTQSEHQESVPETIEFLENNGTRPSFLGEDVIRQLIELTPDVKIRVIALLKTLIN